MKKLIKKDNKNCYAKLSTITIYINNEINHYSGKVDYYENGTKLFTEKSVIIRMHLNDAIDDAENLAKQNGF
jgi:hypothetical protein